MAKAGGQTDPLTSSLAERVWVTSNADLVSKAAFNTFIHQQIPASYWRFKNGLSK